MSDVGRALAIAGAYELAIQVVESLPQDEALEYLRNVAARQRRAYEDELEYARITRLMGPARPADVRDVSTVEPDRVTS